MNTRIKQLLYEARIYDGSSSMTQSIVTCPASLDQFAELIVRECVRKVEDMIDNGWHADTEELKKHFGVEE